MDGETGNRTPYTRTRDPPGLPMDSNHASNPGLRANPLHAFKHLRTAAPTSRRIKHNPHLWKDYTEYIINQAFKHFYFRHNATQTGQAPPSHCGRAYRSLTTTWDCIALEVREAQSRSTGLWRRPGHMMVREGGSVRALRGLFEK